jgi:hypothetical protein
MSVLERENQQQQKTFDYYFSPKHEKRKEVDAFNSLKNIFLIL